MAGRDELRQTVHIAIERVKIGCPSKSVLMVGLRGAGNQLIPKLSDTLFWDTERSRLGGAEKHAAFIIIRTMERGSKEEVLTVWNFYGEAPIKEALLNAPSLSPETISFFANQFDLPAEAFRSHKRAANWAS